MNAQEMLRLIDSIARDRNVDRETLLTDLEQAMVSAARRHYGTLDLEEFTCSIDRATGEMVLYRHGEPMTLEPGELGRIAAQTFKQVMIQRFREDERASIYEEFSGRVGELLTGVAQRYEGGALIVQIDRAEGFMPRSEQIPGEQFNPGDRIRCLLLECRDMGNQVKIVLSRANPDFIRRLFEVEVPEVGERIIEIKAMAREAGYRTKVAVTSIDSKVDAVGACVGVRGSRIRNIVDELNGEKIDIVRWNESSQVLIQNALKPAEVEEISLCFELGRATVVVRDDQLSLAIGKRGQNVRLAARLTGWDVDILTPAEFNKGLEIMAETLGAIEGVTEEMLDRLAALGMVSVFDIEEVGAEVLVNELEIAEALAQEMVERAAAKAKEVAEQQAREKEEAERRKAEEEEAARRLLAGEAGEEGVSADLAAAAILAVGTDATPAAPADDAVAEPDPDQAHAEAILSGAERPEDETLLAEDDDPTPARAGEADDGYDPDDAGEAPTASDQDRAEGEQITDAAVHQVLKKYPHAEAAESE
ncbi:MAG: transcription termination factor NusA [Planctomycetota bacterium]|nr:MAG: transcription termination factor NusA [Planctomycetota bacterium]